VTQPGTCAACGSGHLEAHLEVAGSAGPEGLIPTTDRFGTALSDIVRCTTCGHMQLERFPSEAELADAYAQAESTDYIEEEPGQRMSARSALVKIERHARRGQLLDVGCWAGFLLDEARMRGWRTLGLEPSEFASKFARERYGLDVRTADLFAAELEPGSFDAVVLAAPDAVLHLALPDAGSLVARMLGARWWSVIPTHVQYFTRRSLATLLQRRGWELVELTTAPKAFTVRYYLGRVGGYSRVVSQSLVRTAERVRVADRIWALDLHDRMAAVARAPRG
jgi:hypothetical protein